MFNFSANHIIVLSSKKFDKCTIYNLKDLDTKRCYKAYDYSNSCHMTPNTVYCISGKVNSHDKLYLILEHCKKDARYYAKTI